MFTVTRKRPADRRVDYGASKTPKLSAASTSNDVNFNRMKVCVRVRPLSQKEKNVNSKTTIDVIDNTMLVFDPVDPEATDQFVYHGKRYKEFGKRPNKNLQFVFDRVFDNYQNNITVYQDTTKDLVDSLLAGFNCSVFAYGSTGSGKTHTMLGSADDPGIIFYTTMDLYKKLEEEENKNLELSISYFEIYNEILYDLLDPTTRKPLSVLEDSNKGMTVKNLSVHQPHDADHLIEMLEFGNKNRKQHPTDANSESSRSHAIFQISLRRKDFSASQEMTIQVSKMSLIDLAGSERATAYNSSKTINRSNALDREGSNINKSLLALGNCINALANKTSKVSYIPYRSSKLTLILRDSLGGNCQTLMIATVSPSTLHYEQSHNTLLYAERSKGVQLNVRKNNITVNVQPRDYRTIIDQVSAENAKIKKLNEELKMQVQRYKEQAESVPIEPINSTRDAIDMLHAVKNTIDFLFARRLELRAKLLDCEHHIRIIDLRLLFRKKDNERIAAVKQTTESDDLKCSSAYSQLHNQKLHYANQLRTLQEEVEENEEKISRFETELMEKTNEDMVIRSYFLENNCHAQVKDIALGETHTANVLEDLMSREEAHEEMIIAYHDFAYRSMCVLKAQGLLSEEMEHKYKAIVQKLEGKKTVAWKDIIETPKVEKMKEKMDLTKLPIFLSATQTPIDKRSLVSIHYITPTLNRFPAQQNGFTRR